MRFRKKPQDSQKILFDFIFNRMMAPVFSARADREGTHRTKKFKNTLGTQKSKSRWQSLQGPNKWKAPFSVALSIRSQSPQTLHFLGDQQKLIPGFFPQRAKSLNAGLLEIGVDPFEKLERGCLLGIVVMTRHNKSIIRKR